jgi:hypothetical protein
MSYVGPILVFLMVLSPLFIPIGVTVVHAVITLRSRRTALVLAFTRWQQQLVAVARRRRRVELAVEFN